MLLLALSNVTVFLNLPIVLTIFASERILFHGILGVEGMWIRNSEYPPLVSSFYIIKRWRDHEFIAKTVQNSLIYYYLWFLKFRYRGWLLSLTIAKFYRCHSVRLGRCGLFYLEHIKLCLVGGITIEIDDFRLTIGFFNTHYTWVSVLQLKITIVYLQYYQKCDDGHIVRYFHIYYILMFVVA